MSKILDIESILEMMPHRYPFLLLDRLLKVQKDEFAIGLKNVTINEPFFSGHFPKQKRIRSERIRCFLGLNYISLSDGEVPF